MTCAHRLEFCINELLALHKLEGWNDFISVKWPSFPSDYDKSFEVWVCPFRGEHQRSFSVRKPAVKRHEREDVLHMKSTVPWKRFSSVVKGTSCRGRGSRWLLWCSNSSVYCFNSVALWDALRLKCALEIQMHYYSCHHSVIDVSVSTGFFTC